jgi:hypothetical protein
VVSGIYGKIFIDGEWQTNLNECKATVKMDKRKILLPGDPMTKYKKGTTEGTGTMKGYKVTSRMIQRGFEKFEIITKLDDPEAYGYERIRYIGCMQDELALANFQHGQEVAEETPFTFEDWELLDPIEAE